MTDFDFDRVIDRRGTHSVKWDMMGPRFGMTDPDAIPMWVADMDFAAPPAVNDAIRALCDHGVHGYFGDLSEFNAALVGWLATRHGWTAEPGWFSLTHGIVSAIGLAVQAYTEPGEGVVVFSPVYHMFGNVVRANDRLLIECELKRVQGRYEIDFEALDRLAGRKARMLLLCSPHNPGGRVWSAGELRQIADFCKERDLILVSDEIHHDLVYPEATHHVMPRIAPDFMDRMVVLVAPTKTFNIAGALTGIAIIPDADLHERFHQRKLAAGVGAANRFGVIAATAAYAGGAAWLDALIPYLAANRDRLAEAVATHMPGVRAMPLEATYLAWLDFRETGLAPDALLRRVQRDARIAVNPGPAFGKGGAGWLRFNFACPRATLDRAIDRLVEVFG